MINKNKELLDDFIEYCNKNKNQRFWQALRNWSGADFILFTKEFCDADTFYWDKKDEFNKTVDEQ